MSLVKFGIAADHAGFEYKQAIIIALQKMNIELKDFGTNDLSSCDYPDYIHPLAKEINNNTLQKGIIICGSGNGVNITANKYENVRSALCWLPEIAQLARKHNDANIVAIPARFIDLDTALEIVCQFFKTEFEGGRHQNRVDKIKI